MTDPQAAPRTEADIREIDNIAGALWTLNDIPGDGEPTASNFRDARRLYAMGYVVREARSLGPAADLDLETYALGYRDGYAVAEALDPQLLTDAINAFTRKRGLPYLGFIYAEAGAAIAAEYDRLRAASPAPSASDMARGDNEGWDDPYWRDKEGAS